MGGAGRGPEGTHCVLVGDSSRQLACPDPALLPLPLRPPCTAQVRFSGWARMAQPLDKFAITEVRKPRVGENKPAGVTAEITINTAGALGVRWARWARWGWLDYRVGWDGLLAGAERGRERERERGRGRAAHAWALSGLACMQGQRPTCPGG